MTNPVADWGEIVVETDIDRALILRLVMWMPTYLTHTETARNLAPHLLARPNLESYQNALEDDTFPDGRLPALVVSTARTVRWTGSSVLPFPDASGQGRFLAAAMNTFTVFVDQTLTGDGPISAEIYPPPDPVGNPDQPYDPLAVVREVTTQIVARS
jgi:hypothetical protein